MMTNNEQIVTGTLFTTITHISCANGASMV